MGQLLMYFVQIYLFKSTTLEQNHLESQIYRSLNMERNNIMKFLLRHFYNISIFIGIITILLTIVFWQDLVVLQRLALLILQY